MWRLPNMCYCDALVKNTLLVYMFVTVCTPVESLGKGEWMLLFPFLLILESQVVCPAGYYFHEYEAGCVACPVGTYRSTIGGVSEADCWACPALASCAVKGSTIPLFPASYMSRAYLQPNNTCIIGGCTNAVSTNGVAMDCSMCLPGYAMSKTGIMGYLLLNYIRLNQWFIFGLN